MQPGIVAIMIGAAACAAAWLAAWRVRVLRRRARRARLQALPFPAPWEAILQRNVRLYRRMPPVLKARLHGTIHVFLDEKELVGCRGLDVTDEMRVTIAGQACLLILNRPHRFYPTLEQFFIHPTEFRTMTRGEDDGEHRWDIPIEFEDVRSGESWNEGAVVLAWDEVQEAARDAGDAFNVVVHECAHQLDRECAGAPALPGGRDAGAWVRTLTEEFARFTSKVRRGRHTFLDEYGATDAAEFFAVASEYFFDMPSDLRARHPELYQALSDFYCLDPAAWG